MKLKWNVFIFNTNSKKIEVYNIFDHFSFYNCVKADLKKIKDKKEFENSLRSHLMYYFWSKAEWEVIIAPWVGGDREKSKAKIDVYDQIIMNFDLFLDYVWSHKEK